MSNRRTLWRAALGAVTAVALLAGGVVMSSCTGSSSDNTTYSSDQGHFEPNVQLKAIVKGVVLDDTGAPVKGAKVFIGDKVATTNEGGQYEIKDVPVTSVINGAENKAGTCTKIRITIKAPEGSDLADTVVVTAVPHAIHNDSAQGGDVNLINIEGGDVGVANRAAVIHNPNTSYVNNLLAEASPAILPHKAASFSGILRDAETGKPVANAMVRLRVIELAGDFDTDEQIQASDVVVSTDKDGKFTVNGLLTSTRYTIAVNGYKFLRIETSGNSGTDYQWQCYEGACSFATPRYSPDSNLTFAGNLLVTPIQTADRIPPKIVVNPARLPDVVSLEVDNYVISNTHGMDYEDIREFRLVWAHGVDGKNKPFTIVFSEPMQQDKVNNDSVFIYDETAKKSIPVSQVSWKDEQTLAIYTSESVPPNHNISIRLKRVDFVDLAGNALPADPEQAADTRALIEPAVDGTYIKIATKTPKPVADIQVTDLRQIHLDEDETKVLVSKNYDGLDMVENFLNKGILENIADVEYRSVFQANFGANPDAAEELVYRLTREASPSHYGYFYYNYAVKFTFTQDSNASKYEIKVPNVEGELWGFNTETQSYEYLAFLDRYDSYELTPENFNKYSNFVFLAYDFAIPVIQVTPFNAFGDEGQTASIVAEDDVPIYVAIQEERDHGSYVDVMTGSLSEGESGDLVDIGSTGSGSGLPIFYATASLYAKSAADLDENDYGNLDKTLAQGKRGYEGSWAPVYTSNDWENFSKERTLGLALTEQPKEGINVMDYLKLYQNDEDKSSLLESAMPITLHGWPAIAFKVKDILAFQDLTKISLVGIPDEAGNAANEGAQAVVRDKMPPMLTNVVAEGNKLTLTFSEPVNIQKDVDNDTDEIVLATIGHDGDAYTIRLKNGEYDKDASTFTGYVTSYKDKYGRSVDVNNLQVSITQSSDKKTVTIEVSGKDSDGNDVDLSGLFSESWKLYVPTQKAFAGSYDVVDARNVPDESGNEWIHDNNGLDYLFFSLNDKTAPKIDVGDAAIDANVTPLKLAIVNLKDDYSTVAGQINMTDTVDSTDNIWVIGDDADNNGEEDYYVAVGFREPVAWDTDGDGDVDSDDIKKLGIAYEVVAADPNTTRYYVPAERYTGITPIGCENEDLPSGSIKVCYGLVFEFSLSEGKAQAGDKLVIENIKDTSGNSIDKIEIKLNGQAGDGIVVSPESAY